MRKTLALICTLFMISLIFTACGEQLGESHQISPAPSNSPAPLPSSKTDIPSKESDTPDPTNAPVLDNTERENIFTSFFTNNYDSISYAVFGGIAGVGFIDLDRDTGIEMIVFDAGASAAMGVQFFDIVDGEVICVSANMKELGKLYGDDRFTDVFVTANFFDDFRLMIDTETKEEFYLVDSTNGAIDFSYHELIRFSCDEDGCLTLESLAYKYEEYDEENGNTIKKRFKVTGVDANEIQYTAAIELIQSSSEDTESESKGIFQWESNDYSSDYDGFVKMLNKALEISRTERT